MKKNKVHNFHIPLPEDIYNKLRQEAVRSHMAATELARYAIAFWLKKAQKAALHNAISEYASAHAGTKFDLDEDMEKGSVEFLNSDKGYAL